MEHPNYSKTSETILETPDLVSELFGRPMQEAPTERLIFLQHQLSLSRPSQYPPAAVAGRIVEKHRTTMSIVKEHDLAIRFLDFGALPQEPMVFAGPDCDWVLVSLACDPLYEHFDNYLPVPPAVKSELVGLNSLGISFSDTAIAHAVRKGALKEGQKLSLNLVKPAPAPQVTARLRFLDRSITKLRQATEAAVRGIAVAGAALSAGALAVPALAAAALPLAAAAPLALIDPILFGVEVAEGWETADSRPVGAFYYVTHWYWPLEVDNG